MYGSSESPELGIEGLNKFLGNFISPPYNIVIAGHPGSGKTTMASTICYSNALKGRKCLYISLQEDKEKLYEYMSKLGLNLKEAESRGGSALCGHRLIFVPLHPARGFIRLRGFRGHPKHPTS